MVDYNAGAATETMKKLEKVEGFKLTNAQIEWSKAFKQVDMMSKAVMGKLQIRFGELEQLQAMNKELSGKKIELLKMAPLKTKELPGQEGR